MLLVWPIPMTVQPKPKHRHKNQSQNKNHRLAPPSPPPVNLPLPTFLPRLAAFIHTLIHPLRHSLLVTFLLNSIIFNPIRLGNLVLSLQHRPRYSPILLLPPSQGRVAAPSPSPESHTHAGLVSRRPQTQQPLYRPCQSGTPDLLQVLAASQ